MHEIVNKVRGLACTVIAYVEHGASFSKLIEVAKAPKFVSILNIIMTEQVNASIVQIDMRNLSTFKM